MEFHEYQSPAAILRDTSVFLERQEVLHNLPLGLLRQLQWEEEQGKKPSAFLAAGFSGSRPEVILLQTPPRKMIVCGTSSGLKEAAAWLHHRSVVLPGIVGCMEAADTFAGAWESITGTKAVLTKQQIIYNITGHAAMPDIPGKLTYASEDDAALVMDWTETFALGSLRQEDVNTLEETVMREIRRNQVYFWRDPDYTPVSMAKKARDLTNGVVVNYVYTPEEYARRGYAAACVAALTERLMREGYEFCSVNTDADHQASKALYEKLGYTEAGISREYEFKQQ
ncbi:GNAT family N-acetyltransferase [Bacillus daqingensis]|uniref:GNAT family N-acetyltransferase n=1 Tax=Bacillus daqingensis TaxID=872396 RepID=A0ABV9P0U6_9BACI